VRPAAPLCAALTLSIACHHGAAEAIPLTPATLIAGQAPVPYPASLFTRRVEGSVLLYLVVDSTGAVIRDSTRVAKSSGEADFDAAALQAAPAMRFHPARRGDVPVTAAIQLPVQFTLPTATEHP
jgi:protein TonB